eukprot:GHVS01073016.1.p1 GENE.GHVS01073016.1~~GHVS01073016.1.p1  ORF type:complete len:370 (+),score=25.46 GHVS01073016.1:135-1244(+)
MYCYTQTVAIMADDDQKVKRQDAAVASSSLLSTSSARMYGKYSLKVFWAIGLFFLLSSMETTPAEAVDYPKEMQEDINKRTNADNFTELDKVQIYGNKVLSPWSPKFKGCPIPVLEHLDKLETALLQVVSGQNIFELRPIFGGTPKVRAAIVETIKNVLFNYIEGVDGVLPRPKNITSISFKVTTSHPIWSPEVYFDVKFVDDAGRIYTVKSTRLQATWDVVAEDAKIEWYKDTTLLFTYIKYAGKSRDMSKRFLSYALKPQVWTEMYVVQYTALGSVTYGVYMKDGKRKGEGVFLYEAKCDDSETRMFFTGTEVEEKELDTNDTAINEIRTFLSNLPEMILKLSDKENDLKQLETNLAANPRIVTLWP